MGCSYPVSVYTGLVSIPTFEYNTSTTLRLAHHPAEPTIAAPYVVKRSCAQVYMSYITVVTVRTHVLEASRSDARTYMHTPALFEPIAGHGQGPHHL